MLLTSLSYKEIDKRHPLTEDEFHGVVKTMIKQHVGIDRELQKGSAARISRKRRRRSSDIEGVCPPRFPADELAREVEEAIRALGAKDRRTWGR